MLQITITPKDFWDSEKDEFVTSIINTTIKLEHSLVSISKWESKWNKSFFDKRTEKTDKETLDYIKCMTITQNVDDKVYSNLSKEDIIIINNYIQKSMTATTFNEIHNKKSNEIVTSELIYYWMITLNIPMECQRWHISRLLTLIRVCNIKNTPPKKMNKRELSNRNASLNKARRSKFNSKG